MTTTKFKNWKTTKNKNTATKALKRLQQTYPKLQFQMIERQWRDKDKKSFSIRTITRKGSKRNA